MRELRPGGLEPLELVGEALPDGVTDRGETQRRVGADAVASWS